jgi:hypothetical protein
MDTYCGRREGSPTADDDYRGLPRQVVAITAAGQKRRLAEATEPEGYPISVRGEFEWGYDGSGPINLAAAILADALDFLPSAMVVLDFCEAVVAEFPGPEFELTPAVLQTWLDTRLTTGVEATPRDL